LELRGHGGGLGGVKAGTDKVENAAELKIVANHLRELLGMGFRIVSARAKVGYSEANFFDTQAGANAEPRLLPLPSVDRNGR
jgi:hypothetical protein